MRGRELHGYDNRGIRSKTQSRQVFIGQMKRDGFPKVSGDFVQAVALSDDGNLETFRHVSRLFPGTNHGLDRVLEHLAPPLYRPV